MTRTERAQRLGNGIGNENHLDASSLRNPGSLTSRCRSSRCAHSLGTSTTASPDSGLTAGSAANPCPSQRAHAMLPGHPNPKTFPMKHAATNTSLCVRLHEPPFCTSQSIISKCQFLTTVSATPPVSSPASILMQAVIRPGPRRGGMPGLRWAVSLREHCFLRPRALSSSCDPEHRQGRFPPFPAKCLSAENGDMEGEMIIKNRCNSLTRGQITQSKIGQSTEIDISPKMIHKWPLGIQRHA